MSRHSEARALIARGRECLRAGDFAGAERYFRGVLAEHPAPAEAYELLGKLLYRDGRGSEAAALYRQWRATDPTNPIAAHLVSATGGAPAPARASDAFVVSLYERAAPEFDVALERLGYRAPELLLECATQLLERTAAELNVLDLGCGTGLCGERFRPLARRLVGVDLSLHMLERARQRACYDELVRQELTEYLGASAERFDLVTAADVFCYFGDLRSAFAAVAAILRPRGCFVFSVEELSEPEAVAMTALLEHGRYAHSPAHLKCALAAAGLQLVSMRADMVRFERGSPVQGLIGGARDCPAGR